MDSTSHSVHKQLARRGHFAKLSHVFSLIIYEALCGQRNKQWRLYRVTKWRLKRKFRCGLNDLWIQRLNPKHALNQVLKGGKS